MNNIGRKIKELRKKNNLTQDKMAELLGVTYQSVSKWECGTTMPDITMIVPLARLLRVSTDELLGMKPMEQDERKAYFDSEYVEFWKKEDHEADYKIAKQATEEYPREYKYFYWLGAVEYYISFNRESQKEFIEMMDNSIKHSLTAYENCDNEDWKNTALWNIICAYRYSDRIDEAKQYAYLYPKNEATSRNDAIALCLEGEELLEHQQSMLSDTLSKLCGILGSMWTFRDISDPRVRACVEAEKTIIEAVISDDNALRFCIYLSGIHEKLADIAIASKDYHTAVKELEKALKYAIASDRAQDSGKQRYTCLILDHCDYEYPDQRKWGSAEKDLLNRLRENTTYAPLRDCEDFKALISE